MNIGVIRQGKQRIIFADFPEAILTFLIVKLQQKLFTIVVPVIMYLLVIQ